MIDQRADGRYTYSFIYFLVLACGPNNPGRNSYIAESSSCKNKDKNNLRLYEEALL